MVILVLILCALFFFTVEIWNRTKILKKHIVKLKEYSSIQNIKEEEHNKHIVKLNEELKKYSSIQNIKEEQSKHIVKLKEELKKYSSIQNIEKEQNKLISEKNQIALKLIKVKTQYEEYNYNLNVKEMAFYQPKYIFLDIFQYSEAFNLICEAQKKLIKQNLVIINISDNDAPLDKSFKNVGNLAVNAINNNANSIIESVNYNNFEKSKEKLINHFIQINKMIELFSIKISEKYIKLKIKEMAISYDYREAEQELKSEQADLKEQMKEEEKSRVEAETARKKVIEEQEKYEEAIKQAKLELNSKSEDEKEEFKQQIIELQEKLKETKLERTRATSMAQITRKGYVYIISNIGSFGEKVFKIGMTRRKDPMDRVKELGDASVPFSFDVHAMVHSEDAPSLEKVLHKKFNNYRINKINNRKEFFNISINEISKVCDELGHTVDLTILAEAREYRESLEINSNKINNAA